MLRAFSKESESEESDQECNEELQNEFKRVDAIICNKAAQIPKPKKMTEI